MNAHAETQTRLPAKVPVNAGGQVAALVPQSMEEAFRVAQAIAASGLAPKGLDKPEQVLVAIMAGAELGLAPFQSLQSIAVVNGRPTLYGDGLVAIVRAQGARIKEWLEGDDESLTAHCEVTRPEGEVIGAQFSVADAKKAALWGKTGPWQQYPRRMLAMRARAWALRDGCADMLRGFQVREEVEDFGAREVKPVEGTGMRARLEQRGAAVGGFDPAHVETELAEVQEAEFHDPQTGEVIEATVEPEPETVAEPDDPPQAAAGQAQTAAGDDIDPLDWAASFGRGLAQLETVDEVADAWTRAKADGHVAKLKAASPGMAKSVADAVNARVAEIKGGAGD